MSEIKKTIERYNWDLDDYMIRAYEADDGNWVAYEDVADLITENERLREALKKIACRAPCIADDPWKIAREALKEDGR